MKILKWLFESFTKPQYKLTFVDSLKVLIIIVVLAAIVFGLWICYYYLKRALRRHKMRRICEKYEKYSKKD